MDWIKIKGEHIVPEFTNAEIGALVRFQLFIARYGRYPTVKEQRREIGIKDFRKLQETLSKLEVSIEEIQRKVEEDIEKVQSKRRAGKERQRKYRLNQESNALRNGADKIREDKNIYSEQSSPKNIKNMKNYEEPTVDFDGNGEIEQTPPKGDRKKAYDLIIKTIDEKYGTKLCDTRLKQYTALKKLKEKNVSLGDILHTYDNLYNDDWWKNQDRRPDLHSVLEKITSKR